VKLNIKYFSKLLVALITTTVSIKRLEGSQPEMWGCRHFGVHVCECPLVCRK